MIDEIELLRHFVLLEDLVHLRQGLLTRRQLTEGDEVRSYDREKFDKRRPQSKELIWTQLI